MANVIPAIACNNSRIVLACIYILPDSTFSDAKKIPEVGLDQWMNLSTKIVIGGDEGQTIVFTCRFCIKPVLGSIYLKEAICNNNEIVQIN